MWNGQTDVDKSTYLTLVQVVDSDVKMFDELFHVTAAVMMVRRRVRLQQLRLTLNTLHHQVDDCHLSLTALLHSAHLLAVKRCVKLILGTRLQNSSLIQQY